MLGRAAFASIALRSATRSVAAPVLQAAARVVESMSSPSRRSDSFAPAVAIAGASSGAEGGLQRRAIAGVDDLEGTTDDDDTDTLDRIRGTSIIASGLRERITGLSILPGFELRNRSSAFDSGITSSCGGDSDSAYSDSAPLAEQLALGLESLRGLLSDGIWFAVPKRKVRHCLRSAGGIASLRGSGYRAG